MTSKWHLWPKETQKALIHVLIIARKPNKVTVANTRPLNANTFILVSFFSLLSQSSSRRQMYRIVDVILTDSIRQYRRGCRIHTAVCVHTPLICMCLYYYTYCKRCVYTSSSPILARIVS